MRGLLGIARVKVNMGRADILLLNQDICLLKHAAPAHSNN